MVAGKRKFGKSIGKIDALKSNIPNEFPGSLGVPIGGEKRVEVANREGYVYVRVRDDLSELIQAYNDQVSPVYGLPVIIIRDETDRSRYRIKGRDLGRYGNWGTSAYVPKHGAQHSFDPKAPGGDPVWVWGRQFMPLAATPSGTSGGPNVLIQGPSIYYQDRSWLCAGGTGTADLLPDYKPTGAWARMVLVYLDNDTNPQLLGGDTYFATNITGTSQITQFIPSLPDSSVLPIAGVRLLSGTSTIGWNNIYDVRPHLVGDGFITTGSAGHIIQEDGAAQSQRIGLNFVGDGFEVWNTAGATVVSGTASGGLFPYKRIPYADTDMYLKSDEDFNVTDAWVGPSQMIGGLGDAGDLHENYALNLVTDAAGYNLGLWGYGTFEYPSFDIFSARGTEASPTETKAGDTLFEWLWYGYRTAPGGWTSVGGMGLEALDDFDTSYSTKFVYSLGGTGTASIVEALDLRYNEARFKGDISIPTGTSAHPYPAYYYGERVDAAAYPDGTWRTTRDGASLVDQKKVAGSWVTQSSGGGETVKVSNDDTTADYLEEKITAGDGIFLLTLNGGGDESLRISITGSVGVIAYSKWDYDAPPISPSALDDEFSDGSLATGTLWAEFDPDNLTAASEDIEGLHLLQTASGGWNVNGMYQSIPPGDFTITTKVSYKAINLNYYLFGLALWEDATDTTKGIYTYDNYPAQDVATMSISRWTNYQAYNSALSSLANKVGRQTVYLRIRRNGTTYSFDRSNDGKGWNFQGVSAIGFTPSEFGISININNSTYDAEAIFEYFRYTASDAGVTSTLSGRAVNVLT